MKNKTYEYLLDTFLVLMGVFCVLSAVAINKINNNCTEAINQMAVMQSEIVSLKQQLDSIALNEDAPEEEVEPEVCIEWDYDYVLRVVAAECRGESLEGQMAVAQVIQERADARNMTPEEVVKEKNQFAAPVSMDLVNDTVREACERVFINGEKVTDKPIKYFYSTRGGFVSAGHEKKTYVMTIGYHKFFMD